MPKVSVIVPVYQVEAWLARCIDSILAQTLSDFELILVDDGTRDSSGEIMEEYAGRDIRIRTIHKKNGGLSSARNAGLEIASGEYIAFLDSDDYAVSTWLEDTVSAAERTGAETVLYNYYRMKEGEDTGDPYLPIRDDFFVIPEYGLAKYFYNYWMPYRHGQEAWSRIYRREVIEKHHLRFAPNDEIFAEDTLFSGMYLMHTRKLCSLSKPYIYYIQREDSLMGKPKPRLARRLINLGIRFTEYVKETGHEQELHDVMPVLCYDKLFCKGIRLDPSTQDVREAMHDALQNETLKQLLKDLRGISPLLSYMLATRKGVATQVRGRIFAARWLKDDIDGAMALIQNRVGV